MTFRVLKQKMMLIATGASFLFLVFILVCVLHPRTPEGAIPCLAVVSGICLFLSTILGAGIQRNLRQERDKAQYRDRLSGLGNELQLQRDLPHIKVRDGHAYVLLRLNGFSWLNILFGFGRGEGMIRRISPLLDEFAQSHDGKAYRISLDYYAMLLAVPEDPKAMQELFERFFATLEEIQVEDRQITYSYHYTFSYIVCRMSSQNSGPLADEQLLSAARSTLLRIDGDTFTSGVILNQESLPDLTRQQLLNDSIEQAWKNREFVPYYLMIYDLKTSRPVGAELLTRWIFPEHGIVMPRDFVPLMEERGMIMDLDLYMLEEACKKIKKWIDDELVSIPLTINISKLNIHRANFADLVIGVVKKYDIPPVLIELELNESVVIFEKTDSFIDLIDRLHKFGFTLSMDRFAESDYSSINLLRSLEVDVIKVSPSFFAGAKESRRKRIFASAALEMFRELKIKVVVTNVETEEQVALCREFGCGLVQGFYFAQPISNEEFEKQIF